MVVLQEALRRLVSQKCILGIPARTRSLRTPRDVTQRDGGLQKALKRASQKKMYFGREYQHEQDP